DPQIPAVEPDDLPPPVEDPPVPGPRAPPGKGHDVPQRCHPIPCRPHREEDIYVTPPARRSAPKPARKPPRRPVRVARVYDPPDPDDGVRVLVDRLWPRGLKKADAALDHWCKDVAPSNDLRTWYRHDPALFEEFATRYRAELDGTPQAAPPAALRRLREQGPLTLLTATKDPTLSDAQVLATLLNTGRNGKTPPHPAGSAAGEA